MAISALSPMLALTAPVAVGCRRLLPRSVYESLSEEGRRIAKGVASDNEEIDDAWAPDWDVEAGKGGGSEENQKNKGEVLPRL